jgi:hypothetical protein
MKARLTMGGMTTQGDEVKRGVSNRIGKSQVLSSFSPLLLTKNAGKLVQRFC